MIFFIPSQFQSGHPETLMKLVLNITGLYNYIFLLCFLLQALCGCTVNVPTLDNRMMPLPCSDIIKPSAIRRLRGEGLPLPKSPSKRGDLLVEFQVLFPDRIPPQSREIIKHSLAQC